MRRIAEMPSIKKWFEDSGLDVPMGSPQERLKRSQRAA
jgi:hypothetical protein